LNRMPLTRMTLGIATFSRITQSRMAFRGVTFGGENTQ
jgi:hypothetical protein